MALVGRRFSDKARQEELGIDPYIATGREPHHKSWRDAFLLSAVLSVSVCNASAFPVTSTM